GRWQVGRLTKIDTGLGDVTIDLTEAEFDDWDVKIVVRVNMGSVTVIAPQGLDVRQVGRGTAVNSTLQEPIPGFSRGPAQRVLQQGENPPDASEGETAAPLGMAPATQAGSIPILNPAPPGAGGIPSLPAPTLRTPGR